MEKDCIEPDDLAQGSVDTLHKSLVEAFDVFAKANDRLGYTWIPVLLLTHVLDVLAAAIMKTYGVDKETALEGVRHIFRDAIGNTATAEFVMEAVN